MQKIWKQLNRHWDIVIMLICSLFVAGMAWANLNSSITALQTTVGEHSEKIASQSETLDRMDYNVQIIARKVGVEPLKKVGNE